MHKESSSTTNRPHYAGLGRRFAALVVDFVVLSMVFFPVTKLAKGVWIMSRGDHLWGYGRFITDPLCITFLVVIVLYFVLLEGAFGATIGKRVLSMRVVIMDGRNPGMMRSLIRNILRAIDALPAFSILGVVLILLSPERARFGDRVAGTRVVLRR